MAPVIPLPFRRIKTILTHGGALAARFCTVERTPPKEQDLRPAKPGGRIAGRELDALAGIELAKFVHRARRNAKLHFFRVFKLVEDLKVQADAAAFRPVAERLRVARWMLRL